ncbi:phosphoribosyltransferase-like protein [Pseudoalteromonas maricaloris]|uniref:phosphoribosyltransferase-like protein n=1 Tax=Pseudoalteromonas maricaloris TaxID=184924 RepID=UPI003C1D33E5
MLDWLESENIVARLKFLELIERKSRYREQTDGIEHRFALALESIPDEHKEGALAIFSSILYITQPVLIDAWKSLWWKLQKKEGLSADRIENEVLILELDRDQLRDSFYKFNNIAGRLQDNLPWHSSNDLIDALIALENGALDKTQRQALLTAIERPVWLNLVDISLSGTSVESDLARLNLIAKLRPSGTPPRVITTLLIATEQAEKVLKKVTKVYYKAIGIPNSASLSNEFYSLIVDQELVKKMHLACDWFAAQVVCESSTRFAELAKENSKENIAKWGFKEGGWSVITCNNAPNNSLPILWFESERYKPPFPRVDSRTGNKSWGARKEWLKGLTEEKIAKIKDQLSGI